ncbi:1977_t:CDS:10 [Funneliformis geosporum]|nr:1977_t:CDS:10 [Funneliformis geosporum]
MERNGTCVRNARIECQEFNREREYFKFNDKVLVNPVNSDWIEIENMTEQIINSYTNEKVEDITDETVVDQLQSISVSWSPLCIDEYFDPVSIIAIGSKAGTVTFWSYNDGVNFLDCLQAHETWVTISAWSQWIRLENEQYASSFVTGCVEGSVYLWQVNLSKDFSDNENERNSISVTLRMVLANEDGRIVEIMKWYDSADGSERFAMIKGRKIYVWISDESMLLYQTQIISLDFTIPMSKIVTGLTWRYDGSQLRVFTMDGIHWTFNISKEEGIYIDDEFSLIEEAKNQEEAENDSSLKEPIYYGADSSANGLFVAVVFVLESRTVQYLTDKFEVSHVTFVATENYGNMEMRETLTKQLLNKFEDSFLTCRKSMTYIMWDLLEYCDPENEYYEDDSFFSILEKAIRNDYLQQSTMPDSLQLSETAYFGSLFNLETNELSLPGLIKRFKSQLYHNTLLNKLRILLHLYNNTLRLEFTGDESIEIQNKVQYEVSTLIKYFLEKVLDTIANCLQRGLIVNERDQIFILNLCDWEMKQNKYLGIWIMKLIGQSSLFRLKNFQKREN